MATRVTVWGRLPSRTWEGGDPMVLHEGGPSVSEVGVQGQQGPGWDRHNAILLALPVADEELLL